MAPPQSLNSQNGSLPSERKFSLDYILTHNKKIKEDIKLLSNTLINSNNLYINDISEQLIIITNDEKELIKQLKCVLSIYEELHNYRIKEFTDENGSGSNSTLQNMFKLGNHSNSAKREGNKINLYANISKNFTEIINESAVQKKRADRLMERLKNIESSLNKTDRLFVDKSPHTSHYSNLFDYALKNNMVKKAKDESKSENQKRSLECRNSAKNHHPVDVKKAQTKLRQPSDANSERSKISQQKLNQYLDIENQLDEQLNKVRSNHSSTLAPLISSDSNHYVGNLILNASPTCGVSEESVRVKSMKNSNSKDLLKELHKFDKKRG